MQHSKLDKYITSYVFPSRTECIIRGLCFQYRGEKIHPIFAFNPPNPPAHVVAIGEHRPSSFRT